MKPFQVGEFRGRRPGDAKLWEKLINEVERLSRQQTGEGIYRGSGSMYADVPRGSRYALTTVASTAPSGSGTSRTLGKGRAVLEDHVGARPNCTFTGPAVDYYSNCASTPVGKLVLLVPLEGGGWALAVEPCP